MYKELVKGITSKINDLLKELVANRDVFESLSNVSDDGLDPISSEGGNSEQCRHALADAIDEILGNDRTPLYAKARELLNKRRDHLLKALAIASQKLCEIEEIGNSTESSVPSYNPKRYEERYVELCKTFDEKQLVETSDETIKGWVPSRFDD